MKIFLVIRNKNDFQRVGRSYKTTKNSPFVEGKFNFNSLSLQIKILNAIILEPN